MNTDTRSYSTEKHRVDIMIDKMLSAVRNSEIVAVTKVGVAKAARSIKQAAHGLYLEMFSPHNVVPDANHLICDNRRRFMSPATQGSMLLNLFLKDPDFAPAIPVAQEDYLVVLALCGRELRANVYFLSELKHEPENTEMFNPNWAEDGFFNYHLTPDKTMHLVTRQRYPSLGYNPYFVEASYARVLTVEEEAMLKGQWLDRSH